LYFAGVSCSSPTTGRAGLWGRRAASSGTSYARHCSALSAVSAFPSPLFLAIHIAQRFEIYIKSSIQLLALICTTSKHYKPWQWDIDNRKYGGAYSFVLVLVSTVPSGLFYTSYVFFAISLTKVIDLLTNAETTFNAINLFIILNMCVWVSIGVLLVSALLELPLEPQIDKMAKIVVGSSSYRRIRRCHCCLLTSSFFCFRHQG